VTNVRLLRPARSGIFLRLFHLHSIDYARETIAKICSLGAALATAPIRHPGSYPTYRAIAIQITVISSRPAAIR